MNTFDATASETHKRLHISRRRLLQLLPLTALATLAWSRAVSAADGPSSTGSPLRVGVSPVFPPMVFKQGKELAGAEIDLANGLAEKLGRSVRFVELDWKDQTEALVGGKIDIIMSSMSMTQARQAVMSMTRPYVKIGQMALVRRENRGKHLLGLDIQSDSKVAVLKGTTGEFLVQREFPRAKRRVYTSGIDAAKALIKGNVEMLITDSTLIWYLAGTYAAEGLTALPNVLTEEYLAWGVRRGDDELLAAANNFLAQSSQDGSLANTLRRWMAVQ